MHFWCQNSRSKWNTIGNKFLADSNDKEAFDFEEIFEIDTASPPITPQKDDIAVLDLYAAALVLDSNNESLSNFSNSNQNIEIHSDSSSIVSIDMNNNPKNNNHHNFDNHSSIDSFRTNSVIRSDAKNFQNSKKTLNNFCSNHSRSDELLTVNNNHIDLHNDQTDKFHTKIPGFAKRRISNTSEHTLFTVASLNDDTVLRLSNLAQSPSLVQSSNKNFIDACKSTSLTCNNPCVISVDTKISQKVNNRQQSDLSINAQQSDRYGRDKNSSKNSQKFTLSSNFSSTSKLYSSKLCVNKFNRDRRCSFGQQSRVASRCSSLTSCAVTTLFSMTISTLVLGALAALLVFQNDVLALSSIPVTTSKISKERVCQTDACRNAGKSLYASINFSRDPCQDFFEYACGGWVSGHPIPDDKSRVGTFSSLSELVDSDLRDVLDEAAKNKKANPNAYKIKSLNYGIDMYTECLDRDTIRSLGDNPVKDLLKNLLKFDWPLISDTDFNQISLPGKSKLEVFKETWLRLYHVGQAPVFTFVVTPDANNTKVRVFDFDHPGFSLGRKEYQNMDAYADQIRYYREFTKNITIFMSGSRLSDKNSREALEIRLQEMFDFERKLALASTPDEDRRSASVWYNRMNFNDLETLTENRFGWKDLINKFLNEINAGYTINGDNILILDDIPYYKKLYSILDETPSHVLQNYIGYMLIRDYIKYTEGNLKQIALEYSRKLRGVQKELPLWQRCVSQAFGDFSFAISRLYVDKYVSSQTKNAATLMIQDLKDAFRNIVKERNWLDDITRNKALQKLDGIRENVAYPEWLLNNTELDKKYGLESDEYSIRYTKGRFLHNALQNNIFSMKNMFRNYLKPVDVDKGWPMPPAMVNAAYMPTQNSITIPVGILRPPFFDAGRPFYINYGAIGAVIGHEITHGFDDQGSQFDKIGNLVNWWTKDTEKNFADGSKCFVNQYGNITDKQTGKKLNGINTQGENIADNGGVRQAYRAFQSYAKRNPVISSVPYLDMFTYEQMFFLGYASVWCGQGRDQYIKNQIDYDPHSPVRYRVNTVLQNMQTFSDAFKCKPGTGMNPIQEKQQRCTLW